MGSLLLGVWLGGALCYAGVLFTPSRPTLPLLGIVLLSVFWPASIARVHEAASSSRGRP